ncbi:tetratricopeptide repeat protein [Paenibacillus woosongensis]|uniref:Tetratricopeptide repeat protein n=1 Tax=Paenibacillus woosongensis TaxID=307580 RepID=A0AA95KWC2_9BACL|nr:J domain-containing protein [Paenibacillus woosongensis]WHX49495.1 tetratricopeptide repeat protein [Paenibacillus woosongensis]
MSIWEILGVEQTYDTSVIRRAYAKQLKIHHPEDDPQGYQRLREAYDRAMKLAKQHQQEQILYEENEDEDEERAEEEVEQGAGFSSLERPIFSEIPHNAEDEDTPDDLESEDAPDDLEEEIPPESMEEPDAEPLRIPRLPKWDTLSRNEQPQEHNEDNDRDDGDDEDPDEDFDEDFDEDDDYDFDGYDDYDFDDEYEEPDHPVDEFMAQVHALYSDFAARMDTRRWLELLGSDTLWNIDYQRAVAERMLDYCEQNYFLPRDVWRILEEHFRWRERSMEDEDFAEEYPKIDTYVIMGIPGLHMDYSAILQAQDMTDERREEFLRYREAVAISLIEDDRRTAHVNLIKALDIFKDDKDLLRLQTEFYRRTGNGEEALASCNDYIRLSSGDSEAFLMRAHMLLGMNRFSEALEDVQQVLAQIPEHAEALALAGQCQMKLGNMDQAKADFNQALAIDGEDIEAVLGLAAVHRHTESALPYLKGPARKQARREINMELGRLPLLSRLKRAVVLLFSRRWPVLTMIVILHLIINQSIVKHTGQSAWAYVQTLFAPPEIITVHDAAAMDRLPPGTHAVRIKLTNALYTGILEIEDKDAKGSSTYRYLHADKARELGLMDRINGYVCIGYSGNASVMIISNYKQAMEVFNDKTVEISGEMRLSPPQELQQEMDQLIQLRRMSDNYLSHHPLSDYYIVADDTIRTTVPPDKLPSTVMYLTALLILFYIPFVQEARRQWRYMRYN